jgi:hypothetical protein
MQIKCNYVIVSDINIKELYRNRWFLKKNLKPAFKQIINAPVD